MQCAVSVCLAVVLAQQLAKLSEAERAVTSNMLLCNETMNMVAYLTSDTDIQCPFLGPELLSRLVDMLLWVISQVLSTQYS